MVLYVDELFLKNSLMCYLILAITGEILYPSYSKTRIVVTSLITSFITIFLIIYDLNSNFFIRIMILFCMTRMAFTYNGLNSFLLLCGGVFIITFLLGGVASINHKSKVELLIYVLIIIFSIYSFTEMYKRRKWKVRNLYKISFEVDDKTVTFKCFLDTGNFLTSDYKNEPVIIVSKKIAEEKLPYSWLKYLDSGDESKLSNKMFKSKRNINYWVLQNNLHRSWGLKIKDIKIECENRMIINDGVIMLTNDNWRYYDALIGLNLLEGGVQNGDNLDVSAKGQEIVC